MERLRGILNLYHARLVAAIIIGSTIGTPKVNGYTDNGAWLIAGVIFFCAVVASCLIGFKLEKKHNYIILIVIGGFFLDALYIYLRWL